MAATDVLTTAEAKDVLEISGTTHDTELAAMVSGVSQRLDDLCGPVVQRTVTSELHDGGGTTVELRYWPVASVTSVTEYNDTASTSLTAETNASKTADDFLLDGETGRLRIVRRRANNADTTFPLGRRNVEVTYVAGRFADTASVDEKFKRAAGFLLMHLWKQQAPAWHTDREFFDQAAPSGPVVPRFGVPNVVRDILSDELLPPAVA